MKTLSFFLGLTALLSTTTIFVACSDDPAPVQNVNGDGGGGGGGGDGGGTSDGASTADGGTSPTGDSGSAADFCSAKEARQTKCGNAPQEGDRENCLKDKACYESGMRPGVAAGLEKCLVERACGVSDDPCFDTAAQPYAAEPNVAGFVSECNTKRNGCEAADGGSFSDDFCSPIIGLFPSATVDAVRTCLALGCSEVRDCFLAKTAEAGCPK